MSFAINPEDLKQEMLDIPSVLGDIYRRVAIARNEETAAERSLKLLKYKVEQQIRNMYRPGIAIDRKPTEDAIKMEVALHPLVAQAQANLTFAEESLRLLEAELMAYTCKRDMLVSLSALTRAELETIRYSNAR